MILPLPLPLRVFEGALQFEGEGASGLPASVPFWVDVKTLGPPTSNEYMLQFLTRAGRGQTRLKHLEGEWRSVDPLHLPLESGLCVGPKNLRADADHLVVRAEGDEIQLEWVGQLETWEATTTSYQPLFGKGAARIDQTPPRIIESVDPIPPVGEFQIEFTEPVYHQFIVALFADLLPVALEPGQSPTAVPIHASRNVLSVRSAAPMPSGATVQVSIPGGDFAGNPIEVLGTAGRVAVLPAEAPAAGFEDGALQGWAAFGAVGLVETSTLPALEGRYSVQASAAESWRLIARIAVPDTEAPTLRLRAKHDGEDFPDSQHPILPLRIHGDKAEREPQFIYARGLVDHENEISLAPWRGTEVVVAMGIDGPSQFSDCAWEGVSIQLDGFAIDP